MTVIFVKNPTKLKEVRMEQLLFEPIIVQCSSFDADAILERLQHDIMAGRSINELEAIYLPLFHSTKLNPTELFVESATLIKTMQVDDTQKRKMLALLIVLSGKIVDSNQLSALAEEVAKMGNVIIEVFEERGRKAEKEETAKKMIAKGYDSIEIIELTGLSLERVGELRSSTRLEAAPA